MFKCGVLLFILSHLVYYTINIIILSPVSITYVRDCPVCIHLFSLNWWKHLKLLYTHVIYIVDICIWSLIYLLLGDIFV